MVITSRDKLCTSGFFLQTVFEHLGDLLTVLITFDEIMNESPGIHDNWKRYKRYIKDGPFESVVYNNAFSAIIKTGED